MNSGLQNPLGCVCLSLFFLLTSRLLGADVSFYGVIKSIQYEQTNGPTALLVSTNAFVFNAFAVASADGVLTNASVKPSNTTPLQALSPATNGISWRFADAFQSQSAMDTKYPAGTAFNPVNYTLTMSCTNDGVKSGSVSFWLLFLPVSYPPVPELTNLVAAQSIDNTRDFSLGWNSLGGSSLTIVQLTVIDLASNVVFTSPAPFSPGALSGASLGALIPAHTLPGGSSLVGHLTAASPGLPNTNSYVGATGIAALAKDTEFRIATRPNPAPPRLELLAPPGPPWRLRLTGEPDRLYQIDASSSFTTWTNLAGIYAATGTFDYTDTNSAGETVRFYRARVGQ